MTRKKLPTLSVSEREIITTALNNSDSVVCEALWALRKLRQECIPMDDVECELVVVINHLEETSRNLEHLSDLIGLDE